MKVAVSRGMRAALPIVAWFVLTSAASARADFVAVLSGQVDTVVANSGYAAARCNGEVYLLRDDGSVAGRLAGSDHATLNNDRRAGSREREEILDYFDVPESDRDEDWAHDLVYDERTLAQRRRARAAEPLRTAPPPPPPALVAGAGNIWIATSRKLLRVGPRGDVADLHTGASPGTELLAVGPRVAIGRPAGYELLSTNGVREDFLPLPVHEGPAAVSASGRRWAYATGTEIVWTGAVAPPARFVPDSPIVEIRYCGETLLVLSDDTLVVVAPGTPPEVRSRGLLAKHVLCPEGEPGPWLASGRSLLLSSDQGRNWQIVDTPAGIAITAVAVTAHHLWLASPQGLFLSHDGAAPPREPQASTRTATPARRARSHASWLSWLPKLSLHASTVSTRNGHQVEALAYATIPLDPQRLPVLAVAVDDTPGNTPVAPTPREAQEAADPRDPDRHCLALARRKAVALALAEPERARSYVSRAGHAAWLPEVRLLVSRRYGRSESLDIGTSSTALSSPLGIDTVNDIRYEARATWDLAKLVFSAEELAAQNQAVHMADVRRDIESTMNRLYFERRRLVLERGLADGGARRLRGSEIDAELDSLSGGAFAACTNGGDSQGSR